MPFKEHWDKWLLSSFVIHQFKDGGILEKIAYGKIAYNLPIFKTAPLQDFA